MLHTIMTTTSPSTAYCGLHDGASFLRVVFLHMCVYVNHIKQTALNTSNTKQINIAIHLLKVGLMNKK